MKIIIIKLSYLKIIKLNYIMGDKRTIGEIAGNKKVILL
jgi:hypothetical protein